ncbi:MAG: type I glyceraldehyde-3-phosphate dehydrogenase [Patescibacteria group bacterium]|nr:type I glyceraldehyde-3-phosphate dehydrogenase [Patescibacteria group bacterium]
MIKIGLNGFGRIGRAFTRISLKMGLDIALINTRKTSNAMMRYLLQYDSVYRKFEMEVKEDNDGIIVNGKKIYTSQSPEPENIPWEKYNVDIVVDATGAFTKKPDLSKHLRRTVKKVILTAPAKDEETPFVVLGVNDDIFDFKNNNIISMASCTTNCAAPMFKVINDNFKIISGFLTTTHAVTASQSMLDEARKKEDRSRAAMINIIPSTTGAAKAVGKVIPNLAGKVDGMSLRVPVPTGSITDISAIVEKQTTTEEVNALFKKASENYLKGILDYSQDIIVSSDIIGSPYSCIFDPYYTKVINGNLIKVFGWYDNEWGYSTRLVDLVKKISQFI